MRFVGGLPVQVLDEFNNPVVGVTVTWTILRGGGTLSVRDPFSIVSIGSMTATPGIHVTFAARTSRAVTIAGNLDLYGNFTIPVGTVVNVQGTITLHSGVDNDGQSRAHRVVVS